MKRRLFLLLAVMLIVSAVFAGTTVASPPSGVTPHVLAWGTYDAFHKVKTDRHSPIKFEAKAKTAIDVVVREHDYAIGSTTGWHQHYGPVFITVNEGTLTYYEYDDPTCTPHVVTAGHGFVDSGDGHMVRNESGAPAVDVSVIIAPVGGPLRTELPAPNPYCGF
jgi:quercetin dioxygenase-like cupin family protein